MENPTPTCISIGCNNPKEWSEYQGRYRGRCGTCRGLLSRYGITEPERILMLAKQNGKCLICDEPATVIDHDHKTGEIRGMLCGQCNVGIGMFQEDTDNLKAAVRYLNETS